MSTTTDRYRSRHGDYAYARLAARASLAGLESLAAELLAPAVLEPSPRAVPALATVSPVRHITPGAIPGRDTSGRALRLRQGSPVPTSTPSSTPTV